MTLVRELKLRLLKLTQIQKYFDQNQEVWIRVRLKIQTKPIKNRQKYCEQHTDVVLTLLVAKKTNRSVTITMRRTNVVSLGSIFIFHGLKAMRRPAGRTHSRT